MVRSSCTGEIVLSVGRRILLGDDRIPGCQDHAPVQDQQRAERVIAIRPCLACEFDGLFQELFVVDHRCL